LGLAAKVDIYPEVGNCAWVAATRALRLTGHKLIAELSHVAKAAGIAVQDASSVSLNLTEIVASLRLLGVRVNPVAIGSMEDLATVVAKNPNAVTIFSVFWNKVGGGFLGHAMVATRTLFGGMRIIDKGGIVVKDLVELERIMAPSSNFYVGIGTAQPAMALVIPYSHLIKALDVVPLSLQIIYRGALDYVGDYFEDPYSSELLVDSFILTFYVSKKYLVLLDIVHQVIAIFVQTRQ
jgi:hypothetical protein